MSDEMQDNLVSIKDKKKKATSDKNKDKLSNLPLNTGKPPEITHGELEARIIKYLTRQSNDEQHLAIGLSCREDVQAINYKIYCPDENSDDYQILLYSDDGYVKEISKSHLAGLFDKQVAIFADYEGTITAKYCFSGSQNSKMVTKIQRSGLLREEHFPKPYGYKSEAGHFFERRDYDPVLDATKEQFPFLYSYLKRMSNNIAFCQVIGSVLKGKVLRKSPIVLYGDTGAGKSVFCRFIKRLIGEKRLGIVPKTFSDIYAHQYVDKGTVAYFSDEANCDLFATNEFKEISGSDVFPVRKMQRDYVSVPICGVYILNLNDDKLRLPKDDAVVKGRIVPCYISNTEEWKAQSDVKDEAQLFARAEREFKYFAGFCISCFEDLNGGAPKYDIGNLEDYCIEESDQDLENLFDTYYEFISDYDIPGLEHNETVTVKKFSQNWEDIARKSPIATKNKNNHDLRNFIKHKLKIKGRIDKTSRIDGKVVKVIRGIKERHIKL